MTEHYPYIDDDEPEDGVIAVPRNPATEPRVKIRALWDYCQQKGGVKPSDLSPEELEMFLVWDKESGRD